jgi:hypothetical protein
VLLSLWFRGKLALCCLACPPYKLSVHAAAARCVVFVHGATSQKAGSRACLAGRFSRLFQCLCHSMLLCRVVVHPGMYIYTAQMPVPFNDVVLKTLT